MFDYKFSLHNAFEAMIWFREQLGEVYNQPSDEEGRKKLEKRKKSIQNLYEEPTDTFEVGKMYLFHYDPKTKHILEYYDTFPLILLTKRYGGGFQGLNLHYLPSDMRLNLLSNLIEKAVLKDGELERLRISYDILKNVSKFQMFRPCLKQYCTSHIRSAVKLIHPVDWGFAAALPLENFKKERKQKIWKGSMGTLDMTL
jgi:hypothetical protein